jgi:hypothetical protein
MSSSFDASNCATAWISAWNCHDLEAILSESHLLSKNRF